MGQYLPVWIIGVPLVFAVIEWIRMPKGSTPPHHSNLGAA
jgi:hypothetical protein